MASSFSNVMKLQRLLNVTNYLSLIGVRVCLALQAFKIFNCFFRLKHKEMSYAKIIVCLHTAQKFYDSNKNCLKNLNSIVLKIV